MFLTDIHDPAMDNAVQNLALNFRMDSTPSEDKNLIGKASFGGDSDSTISVRRVNWCDESTYPTISGDDFSDKTDSANSKSATVQENQVDVILGSDLVYDSAILKVLVPTIFKMLKTGKR